MLAGSIADVIGTRPMVLASSALLAISAACCGVSRNGAELIAFNLGISDSRVWALRHRWGSC
jgi:MFS family permease